MKDPPSPYNGEKISRTVSACLPVMQALLFALVDRQISDSGRKLQSRGSSTIPSFRPSMPSHWARIASSIALQVELGGKPSAPAFFMMG